MHIVWAVGFGVGADVEGGVGGGDGLVVQGSVGSFGCEGDGGGGFEGLVLRCWEGGGEEGEEGGKGEGDGGVMHCCR